MKEPNLNEDIVSEICIYSFRYLEIIFKIFFYYDTGLA